MNELLAYAMPGGMMLAGALAIVIGFGAALTWPRYLLPLFIACMVLVGSSSGYGFEDASDANVFWVKGSRTFFFTFVEMAIAGAWLALLFLRAWDVKRGESWLPTTKYYLGLAVLLAGHFVLGLAEGKHFWLLDLSQRGFSNLLWQGMLISLIVSTVRTHADLQRIIFIIVACLFCRHVFGLVRFVGFGGDPQNAYATLSRINVRITFFDINDSILAAAMFGYCAWRLFTEKTLLLERRTFFGLAMVMAALIPLLSARRTAQGGLLLAFVVLLALLPRGRRLPMVLALVLAVPLALYSLGQRGGDKNVPLLNRVFVDVKVDNMVDPRTSRFHEWATAWQTLKTSPVFGLGPAGQFKVKDPVGLEYHGGQYDYVHSGFGHVFLKAGFVGLLLFCGLLLAWVRYVVKLWPQTAVGPYRALVVGSVAGLTASLPNLVVGTPVTELRTMLVMGLLMALPIVAARVSAAPAVSPAMARMRARLLQPRPLAAPAPNH